MSNGDSEHDCHCGLNLRLKCSVCGGPTTVIREDYDYSVAVGLQSVVLQNIALIHCERCGNKDPIIAAMGRLHVAIAESLIWEKSLNDYEADWLEKWARIHRKPDAPFRSREFRYDVELNRWNVRAVTKEEVSA